MVRSTSVPTADLWFCPMDQVALQRPGAARSSNSAGRSEIMTMPGM